MSPSPPPTDLAARLQDANDRKSDGNDCFRQSKWNEALLAYRSALNILPKRKDPVKSSPETVDDDDDVPGTSKIGEVAQPEESDDLTDSPSDEEKQVAQLRSVLFANIGACHVKLGEHKEAVEACTQALKDDPGYIKALQRRAASNELLGTWSSLAAAQEDYTSLLSLAQPSQKPELESKLRKLKPRVEAAQKKETDEMLTKLKGLGNSLLGNFGLSTDNFKFEPNGQGGYSMNFVR